MKDWSRPEAEEVSPIAQAYVALVPEGDVMPVLEQQGKRTAALFEEIGEARTGDFRYAPGKWTAKEILGHLADTERIFCYRALRLARGDETPLPGFEQADYVAGGHANERTLADLLVEWRAIRAATLLLYESFSPEAWLRRGPVSQWRLSVRGIVFTTVGHELHHYAILREKYLAK